MDILSYKNKGAVAFRYIWYKGLSIIPTHTGWKTCNQFCMPYSYINVRICHTKSRTCLPNSALRELCWVLSINWSFLRQPVAGGQNYRKELDEKLDEKTLINLEETIKGYKIIFNCIPFKFISLNSLHILKFSYIINSIC